MTISTKPTPTKANSNDDMTEYYARSNFMSIMGKMPESKSDELMRELREIRNNKNMTISEKREKSISRVFTYLIYEFGVCWLDSLDDEVFYLGTFEKVDILNSGFHKMDNLKFEKGKGYVEMAKPICTNHKEYNFQKHGYSRLKLNKRFGDDFALSNSKIRHFEFEYQILEAKLNQVINGGKRSEVKEAKNALELLCSKTKLNKSNLKQNYVIMYSAKDRRQNLSIIRGEKEWTTLGKDGKISKVEVHRKEGYNEIYSLHKFIRIKIHFEEDYFTT